MRKDENKLVFNALVIALAEKGGTNKMITAKKLQETLFAMGHNFAYREIIDLINVMITQRMIFYWEKNDTRFYRATQHGLSVWASNSIDDSHREIASAEIENNDKPL